MENTFSIFFVAPYINTPNNDHSTKNDLADANGLLHSNILDCVVEGCMQDGYRVELELDGRARWLLDKTELKIASEERVLPAFDSVNITENMDWYKYRSGGIKKVYLQYEDDLMAKFGGNREVVNGVERLVVHL